MTQLLTRKALDYSLYACGALVVAVLFGNRNIGVLGAAFAVILAIGLGRGRATRIDAELSVAQETLVARESTSALVRLRADAVVYGEVTIAPGPALAAPETLRNLTLRPEEAVVDLDLRFDRWGRYDLTVTEVRATDFFFMFVHRAPGAATRQGVRVYPRPEPLRAPLLPVRTDARTGDFRSRRVGEGVEFADVREWAPGDRVRRINWRMSSRGSLLVNQYHAEEAAVFVLLIDTFTDVQEHHSSTLERAAAGALAVADKHMAQRDRVGLISFGTHVAWLPPNVGRRHTFRIREALLDLHLRDHDVDRDVHSLPRRVLPAGATVIAFSPLLDERVLTALLHLRGSGLRLAAVELVVEPHSGSDDLDCLTRRVWDIRQRGRRALLAAAGVPIAPWPPDQPFEYAAEALRKATRRWQRAA